MNDEHARDASSPNELPAIASPDATAPPLQSAGPPTGTSVKPTWSPAKLDRSMFPERGERGPLTTIANIAYMLIQYAIVVRYNVIKKKLEIAIPGLARTDDNADNVTMTHILSLATLNGINTGLVPPLVEAIADHNAYNPVAEWIRGRAWDGVDRLPEYYATLTCRDGFPLDLQHTMMRKWLLSGVAAALSVSGFKCRGVLTLQGPQGIGKTSWGLQLLNDPLLRAAVVKTDHHLDGANKDSLLAAITHWLVEIGELDSSFRRDVARLKGFLTADSDKVRRPYARVESEYPRRTFFYATVNDNQFLVDPTGNSRWWTLPVVIIDHKHDIDMQQLFAQLALDFDHGAEWWLTADEERQLEAQNASHRSLSVVRERVLAMIDQDGDDTEVTSPLTATDLLRLAGVTNPTNPQAKECGAVLRELFGESRRIQGRDKWRVPLRPQDNLDNLRIDPEAPVKDKFE